MSTEERLKFLQSELEDRIRQFSSKRHRDKSKAFTLKILAVCLAAAITILLGLKVNDDHAKVLQGVALVFGAIITVLNAFDAFFDHRSLWIRETATLARLYSLKADLNYAFAGLQVSEIDREALDRFKDRYEDILRDDLSAWLKLRESSFPEGRPATTSTNDTTATN